MILQGYNDAEKALVEIINNIKAESEEDKINLFCEYLFTQVYILRILVPHDTDLNHYFEIMNSRGEQLEEHEVLKAKCLEVLDECDRYAFNFIWEACSNMEEYVQYEFKSSDRDKLFGDEKSTNKWNDLTSIDNVYSILTNENQSSTNKETIKEILNAQSNYTKNEEKEDNTSEGFNTIINFSNFLIHILKVQTGVNIPLDDKRLIKLFTPYLKCDNKTEFVKQFGYNLLKGKLLFDKYIIKRVFNSGKDEWSLKQLKCSENSVNAYYVNTFGDKNKNILMLLSMFHVSAPTLIYKHWLNASLKYLFCSCDKSGSIDGGDYITYLEGLAEKYLYLRALAIKPYDYYDIIYNADLDKTKLDKTKLDAGTAVDNFIFNYLDYLLWKNYNGDKSQFEVGGEVISDVRIQNFKYTFRSSVEHYYPQCPIDKNLIIKPEWLNNFGNLCLISTSKNSRLSNYMPTAKKDHYSGSLSIDSIKQRIMMEYQNWDDGSRGLNINHIEEHGKKMKELLLRMP